MTRIKLNNENVALKTSKVFCMSWVRISSHKEVVVVVVETIVRKYLLHVPVGVPKERIYKDAHFGQGSCLYGDVFPTSFQNDDEEYAYIFNFRENIEHKASSFIFL